MNVLLTQNKVLTNASLNKTQSFDDKELISTVWIVVCNSVIVIIFGLIRYF
jgi:hypothetical protein